MSNLRYWGQIQKVSQIKPRSAHCSGLVLPYLVLSSDLEFFKEVFCLFICRGFDFVGFFLIWNRPGQSKNLEYFHSCWICRALPQPKGRMDPACAQQGPTERATGAQGHNSPSLDKPPVAPGPRVSPSTSVEEKHLFRYQVSGAGEGSFWPWQDGIFLWSRSQRWDWLYNTETDGGIQLGFWSNFHWKTVWNWLLFPFLFPWLTVQGRKRQNCRQLTCGNC